MKAVVQRVSNANVKVNEEIVGKIENGFVVLLGVQNGDTKENADYLVKKITALRVFSDENDKMNLSLKDVNGSLLVVSQFTLCADCVKGNRPSFSGAADPKVANALYEYFVSECRKLDFKVETGIFGANMKLNLTNDGPVTIILEKY